MSNYMRANAQEAAADASANFGDGVASSNCRNFTLGTTAATNVIPTEWQGRFVRLLPTGSTLYYGFFLTNVTPTLPATPSAAGAGAAGQCEGPYPAGEAQVFRVPKAAFGADVYFGRIGGTDAQSVQMILADGTVGLLGP
jgi:hypothetical protein